MSVSGVCEGLRCRALCPPRDSILKGFFFLTGEKIAEEVSPLTMKVQLLLLLALVGPFCAFTRASPTGLPIPTTEEIPVTAEDVVTDATEVSKEEPVTGPPATAPAAAPEEVATEVFTEAAPLSTVNTEEAGVETETPVPSTPAAPEPLVTDAHVETEAPTEAAEVDVPAEATAPVEAGQDVIVEDEIQDGLSSGQVVGIVIGALLAVVIVIAVVIAVVRRMGKYSP